MTKLAGRLPQGDANGLDAISRALVAEPHQVHVVLALIDCKSTSLNHDTGEVVPTARVRRIEVVGGGQDRDLAHKLLRRALEERTGATVLPFDLEEDLKAAFGRVNPHTGEILDDEGGK